MRMKRLIPYLPNLRQTPREWVSPAGPSPKPGRDRGSGSEIANTEAEALGFHHGEDA